jgi:hypothetical protein
LLREGTVFRKLSSVRNKLTIYYCATNRVPSLRKKVTIYFSETNDMYSLHNKLAVYGHQTITVSLMRHNMTMEKLKISKI